MILRLNNSNGDPYEETQKLLDKITNRDYKVTKVSFKELNKIFKKSVFYL